MEKMTDEEQRTIHIRRALREIKYQENWTWKRQAIARQRRRQFLDWLKSLPCNDCHRTYPPYVMDFDHRPGEEKLAPIARLLLTKMEILQSEIMKCDLLCSNCHRIRTAERLGIGLPDSNPLVNVLEI